MCLQPASQCFTPVLNNIVLSQSVDMSLQPASQSFTGVLQPTILQPRGHLLTASCWTSKSLGQFRGGGEGGGQYTLYTLYTLLDDAVTKVVDVHLHRGKAIVHT